MAESPVFDKACEELEARTPLDRLAVRGTVRIALKNAGLEVGSVDPTQMTIVLRKVLPAELRSRGVDDAESICAAIVDALAGTSFDVAPDRAASAAATIGRFGS